ncbi:cysteine-rich motor neuron 1 protein-like isoform 2-T2 [Pelodytes ibericus]
MKLTYVVSIICFWGIPGLLAYNCSSCEERTCPPRPVQCRGRQAIDPCGCCNHCAKQTWEPCGGENWELGYCDRHFKCANVTGEVLVQLPMVGICKEMRNDQSYQYHWEDDDEICPEQTGCYVTMGMCDCVTKRTCISDFHFTSPEICRRRDDEEYYEKSYQHVCFNNGCNIEDGKCVCETGKCGRKYQFRDQKQCGEDIAKRKCANVTCPEVQELKCPRDSVASRPHTPLGECCPTVPSFCTCDFTLCNDKCPKGKRKIMIQPTDGIPGNCCDHFLCLI